MKDMNRKRFILAIGIIVILLAAGCGGPGTPPPAGNPGPDADGLLGVEWTLVELMDAAPLAGSTTTLTLDGGAISGQAGCNSFGGKYLLQGRKLAFEEVYATEMACEAPAGIMEQEQSFLQTLSQTVSFEVVGERLELRNMAGETTLVFEK